jgi:hypothetical protein
MEEEKRVVSSYCIGAAGEDLMVMVLAARRAFIFVSTLTYLYIMPHEGISKCGIRRIHIFTDNIDNTTH